MEGTTAEGTTVEGVMDGEDRTNQHWTERERVGAVQLSETSEDHSGKRTVGTTVQYSRSFKKKLKVKDTS